MDERLHRSAENIQARHIKRQNQRRRAMKRRRIIFFTVLILIVVSVVLFFTPLFNIKKIEINGNSKIETALIKQAVGSVEEENLFRLNTKKIEENIMTIPYVDSLEIKKSIFPVALKVAISECQPIGYMMLGEQYVILDKNLKVLEVVDTKIENIAEIIGVGITAANPGAVISSDDNDKLSLVTDCIYAMIEQEVLSKVGTINFSDINNISFKYENRLDVICGSSIDFSKKIGMFYMALNSDKLTANSRGTIDISIAGKAIYTP